MERFGFQEALTRPSRLTIILFIGFSSNFVLSLNPAVTLYLFQQYRRVMLKGRERASPPPGHSFVGGALANSIGESHLCYSTSANTQLPKLSSCYTRCCLQRLLFKLLVDLIQPTIHHRVCQFNHRSKEYIPLADSSLYTVVSGRSCSRAY